MQTRAVNTLSRAARSALVKLGRDSGVARKKRGISAVSMAERAFISRGALYKVERGDPGVSLGICATVLAMPGLVDGLGDVAERGADCLGPDIEEDRLPQTIQPPGPRRARSRQPALKISWRAMASMAADTPSRPLSLCRQAPWTKFGL